MGRRKIATRKRVKRTRLATGIWADVYGVGIIVRGKEHRYPLGMSLEELRRERRTLLEEADATPARRGTFAADIETYLDTFPEGPRRRDAKNLLRHWAEAEVHFQGRRVRLGQLSRHAITAVMIEQQLAAWGGRFKPGGRKHLRRELSTFFRKLNGRAGVNPVRDVPQIIVRYGEKRDIAYDIIEDILAAMPDRGRPVKGDVRSTVSLTKIRHTIMAYTGFPPALLMGIGPRDLHLDDAEVDTHPRRKGAGVPAVRQPLSPRAVAAFRALVKAKGLGRFSTRSAAKVWGRAVKKVRDAWIEKHGEDGPPWPLPDDVRPYDLRHSFGTAVMRQRKNIHVVGSLMNHSNLNTTRRYLQGLVSEESREAIRDVTTALWGTPKSSKTLPRAPVKLAKNGRQRPVVTAGAARRR